MPQRYRREGQGRARRGDVPEAFAGDVSGKTQRDVPRGLPRVREPARRHASTQKRDEVARRRPQAVEAERHRPRAPRFDPLAAVASRRRGIRPAAAQLRRARSIRKSAGSRSLRRAVRPFQNGAVTLLDDRRLRISTKTADFATLLFGSAEGRRRPAARTLVVLRRERARVGSARRCAHRHNLPARRRHAYRRARLKDVLGYERLVLTTAAYDALVERARRQTEKAAWTRATSSSLRVITEKSMAGAASSSTPSKCTRARPKTQIRHAVRRDLQGRTSARSTRSTCAARRRTSRAAACARPASSRDWKKAIVTLEAGPEDRAGRRELLRAIRMVPCKKVQADYRRAPLHHDRRFQRSLTKKDPEKSLLEVKKKHSGRNNNGHITCAIRAAARASSTASSTSSAARTASRPRSRRSSTIPTAPRRIALLHYRDGEKRYILAPRRPRGRRRSIESGVERRHQDRQRLPLKNIPLGTRHPQHRAAARRGRQARAFGRLVGAADGQGRRVRASPHAVGRSAQDSHRLPRDDRPARQPRARERSDRQSRPLSATWASARRCAASR